jgi:hypothetical protein
MQTWADAQRERLREIHQTFDVWYVSRFPAKGYTWHARPKGTGVATISADSPDDLDAALRAAETARRQN